MVLPPKLLAVRAECHAHLFIQWWLDACVKIEWFTGRANAQAITIIPMLATPAARVDCCRYLRWPTVLGREMQHIECAFLIATIDQLIHHCECRMSHCTLHSYLRGNHV